MAVEGEDDNRTHLTIEHVELDRLKPDPFNPRRIAEQDLDALTRSIQEFGFVDPIIARREDRAVIGGHQRLLAARRLGLASVPVIFVDLSPEQAKLLNLSLNKISGAWDEELLARLLAELNETPNVDITLSGFAEDETAKLLKTLELREKRERPEVFDVDAAWEAATADPGVRRGDIWLLGGHRLMCGDSADRGDVSRLMAGQTATLMVTDPPYGVAYEPGGRKRRRPIANDDLGRDQAEFWAQAFSSWPLGGDAYVFSPSGPLDLTLCRSIVEAGIEHHQWLIWVKDRLVLGHSHYHYRHEHIFYGWKGRTSWNGSRKEESVWEEDRPQSSPQHPTMKPASLFVRAMAIFTPFFSRPRLTLLLDQFLGGRSQAFCPPRTGPEPLITNIGPGLVFGGKVGGQARAMVVTSSIQRAISYFYAIRDYLAERKSPYRAIAAFSGEHEYSGTKVTEASLNGFSSNLIADRIQEDPYRFLVCADKFQTGYDEPLLHTMYVDKILSGVKAVQTLSRLNRAHPKKHDAFVLDFNNDADTIQDAFADYYRTTVLAEEADPQQAARPQGGTRRLSSLRLGAGGRVGGAVLSGADRDQLDPILDACVSLYREQLDEDGQVDFKGKAKAFLRAYGFLVAILPYTNAEWEKLSIFLNFLVPKLPAPIEDDLSKGILEAIDMDSYRVEKQAVRDIQLPDEDAEIKPVSTDGGGQKPEPEMDQLSNIIKDFNGRFGNIEWKDQDKIERVIAEELPSKVAGDRAYQNAMANSDQQNARIEHDKALERAMTELLADHTELFKQFSDNESFRRWLSEMVFAATYVGAATAPSGAGSKVG